VEQRERAKSPSALASRPTGIEGYGSEAMRLTLNYAFNELNLHRVGLDVLDYNARALHVYEKLGFVHEGAKRQFGRRDGRRYDLVLMGMLRDEWKG
jgi:RimJ/RimL family protein N-acetyltransferase